MKLVIELNTDNAAFEDNGQIVELAYIFKQMLDNWSDYEQPYSCGLVDSNGNSVGQAVIDPPKTKI